MRLESLDAAFVIDTFLFGRNGRRASPHPRRMSA
jgi:hypothetical protein